MGKFIDLTDQRFGRLLPLNLAIPARFKGKTWWTCRCDCGKVIDVAYNRLKRGETRSCGCLRNEFRQNNNRIIACRFTPSQAEKIRKLIKNGISCKEIAFNLGVSRNTIISIKKGLYY